MTLLSIRSFQRNMVSWVVSPVWSLNTHASRPGPMNTESKGKKKKHTHLESKTEWERHLENRSVLVFWTQTNRRMKDALACQVWLKELRCSFKKSTMLPYSPRLNQEKHSLVSSLTIHAIMQTPGFCRALQNPLPLNEGPWLKNKKKINAISEYALKE